MAASGSDFVPNTYGLEPVRCLIVDRSPVYTRGLITLLEESGNEVVGLARTAADAVMLANELQVHLVIVCLEPFSEALDVADQFRTFPVLLLASTRERDDVVDGLRHGIGGIVPKDASPADLVHAVRQVPRGNFVYPKSWMSIMLDQAEASQRNSLPQPYAFERLTPREQQIMHLIVDGKSNKQVAYCLGIAQQTAKNHLAHIMAKLNVSSRLDLLRWAIDHGLVHGLSRDSEQDKAGSEH